jgi:hypothetical protein
MAGVRVEYFVGQPHHFSQREDSMSDATILPANTVSAAGRTLRAGTLALVAAVVLCANGCALLNPYGNASFNHPIEASAPKPGEPPRNTFAVDGNRGNNKVLMFLALSGGGSRAAYLSASTMLALQDMKQKLGADLLAEVDVISSVSGGSIAAAYYGASRDAVITDPALLARLAPALAGLPTPLPKLDTSKPGQLGCSGTLTPEETARLRKSLSGTYAESDVRQLLQLCESAIYPAWERDTVLRTMKTDYLGLWIGNWFWPANIWRYWTSSFDRSDIMAQTLANNVYRRRGLLGNELTLADLNPARPYLLINATNASNQLLDEKQDEFPFGSVFTFTHDDFRDRLGSDVSRYSLARAVMGSSTFPLVFASMTLQDFRTPSTPRCPPKEAALNAAGCRIERFLHIFDGGNSDNLGLRSVKRTLLQLDADGRLQQYDRIIVLLVDAFTTPRGAARDDPDPRSLLSLLIDTNVSDAVDSLLQANRDHLLAEFDEGKLSWDRECSGNGLRQLPLSLCERLKIISSSPTQTLAKNRQGQDVPVLNLTDKLVFYHFGFDDVTRFAPTPDEGTALIRRLNNIPTSFRIGKGDVDQIDKAVNWVISPGNPCLQAMAGLLRQQGNVTKAVVDNAREACKRSEAGRKISSAW